MNTACVIIEFGSAGVAQSVEQLICNQQVTGSSPATSFLTKYMGGFPSGQRGQTVNLLAPPSMVRIHLLPPEKSTSQEVLFCVCVRRTQHHFETQFQTSFMRTLITITISFSGWTPLGTLHISVRPLFCPQMNPVNPVWFIVTTLYLQKSPVYDTLKQMLKLDEGAKL